MRKSNAENLIGKKFGRLVVTDRSTKETSKRVYWKCVCECGKIRIVQAANLRSGNSKSCGCLMSQMQSEKMLRHGYCTRSKGVRTEYMVWAGMKARCYNETSPSYKNYGGRGITVCERWRKSFENFIEDMGERPRGKSLDRINNDGIYEPSNCQWASAKQQSRNSRNTVFIEAFGRRITPLEWESETGVKANTMRARLARYNITAEEAVSEKTLRPKLKRKTKKPSSK